MKLCRFAEELNLRAPLQVNYCKIIALLQKGKRLWQKLPNISFWNTISPPSLLIIWKTSPRGVFSLLSSTLAAAFDQISHNDQIKKKSAKTKQCVIFFFKLALQKYQKTLKTASLLLFLPTHLFKTSFLKMVLSLSQT